MRHYILAITLILAGCSAANTTSQPILNAQGQSVGTMEITFYTDGMSDAQDVVAISSDGERFQGQVIGHKFTQERPVQRHDKNKNKNEKDFGLVVIDFSPYENADGSGSTITTYSSEAEAVLVGDKGHSMRCKFTQTDPEWGMAHDGGVGECTISDGRKVPVSVRGKSPFAAN